MKLETLERACELRSSIEHIKNILKRDRLVEVHQYMYSSTVQMPEYMIKSFNDTVRGRYQEALDKLQKEFDAL